MPIKFAGKLNAFSRGPRGFFVKLEIGADDDWQELAAADLGATFGVVMVPIDAETGVRTDASPGGSIEPGNTGQQRGEAGKPRQPFHKLSRAQQAGILCGDETFQLWLSAEHYGRGGTSLAATDTAELVRQICGVHSRSELSEDRVAGKKWDQLLTNFYQATGRLAEQRG